MAEWLKKSKMKALGLEDWETKDWRVASRCWEGERWWKVMLTAAVTAAMYWLVAVLGGDGRRMLTEREVWW